MSTSTSTPEIDTLIERYLHLLDQYSTLRADLNSLQSSIHLDISRANFTPERGFVRYGQDFYDERMQASRRVVCSDNGDKDGVSKFEIKLAPAQASASETEPHTPNVEGNEGRTNEEKKQEEQDQDSTAAIPNPHPQSQRKAQDSNNPLRWFGILTPQTLRLAQRDAVQMIEKVVPALLSTDAQLKDLEIQIRRARKHLAKAERGKLKQKLKEEVRKESITT